MVLLQALKAVLWNSTSGLSVLILEPLCLTEVVGNTTGECCSYFEVEAQTQQMEEVADQELSL